ncbi:MAG TPA: type IV pilus secretin PilQ family protein [Spongiibacteraceae bacterium]|nr:type IV pilus secretin PilQ family protein [Spongiibacteraceae bacterium]
METRLNTALVNGGGSGRLSAWSRSLQWMALLLTTVWGSSAYAVNLNDVEFNALPGGRFEVQLQFDSTPPEPAGYTIEKPARIALDFPGVTSRIDQKKHALNYENASSAVLLESAGRTRLILNLVELAPYSTRIEGNTLFVEVGDAGVREYLKPVRGNQVLAAATAPKSTDTRDQGIENIDFRRGDNGEGQLVVKLTDPKVNINVFVEGEGINIEFDGVDLPERLQRRYDVTDFATPVRTVEAKQTQRGSLLSLRAVGEYDYLAYQADNEYVVAVKPLTEDEVDQRKKEFAFTGEKLSLNFQDIEVRAVLQLIADFTSLNLVASDTVQGRITLRLQNVPWDQALELVLKTKGLDKRQIGNVLMVAPAAEIAERERQELETRKQVQELAPLQTEYIRIRYANAADLYSLFKGESEGGASSGMISPRGRVIIDTRTNSLLVTETAQNLEEFRRIVKLLDVPIRQVLIEARIVIANADFDQNLGIRWGGAAVRDNGKWFYGGDSNSVLESYNDFQSELGGSGDGTLTLPSALNVDLGVAPRNGQFAVGFANNDLLLSMELSALEAQGKGEIVSQPKVITGDKQRAVIKSGTEVPYQESAANGETTIEFKEAVLKLEVTPNITPDDRIIMTLNINQDSVGDLVSSGNAGGFVPTIDTTELQTQVLVGNGETVVLGGVFRTEDVSSTDKVPFLGDVPYVGRLFTRKSVRQLKTETLIFITPRIMADTLID